MANPTIDQPEVFAVLTWRSALPTDDEIAAATGDQRHSLDFGEQYAYQASHPVATSLHRALLHLGHRTNCASPYQGEGGWHFRVYISGRTYSLFVLWIVLGNDQQCFAIQPRHIRSWRDALLRRPRDFDPLRRALAQALASIPLVDTLSWLTESAFHAVYCDGAPLPSREPAA